MAMCGEVSSVQELVLPICVFEGCKVVRTIWKITFFDIALLALAKYFLTVSLGERTC